MKESELEQTVKKLQRPYHTHHSVSYLSNQTNYVSKIIFGSAILRSTQSLISVSILTMFEKLTSQSGFFYKQSSLLSL